jgi:prepilin-type N-terminal cleavage/methylation domain-containing protein
MRAKGFTLLELIVAFTILSLFVLPMLEIISAAQIRAVNYTRERVVRDLAQRKLFERMYFIEPENEGNFELEGYKDWTWQVVFPPEIVNQGAGDQFLLQYTIRVTTPHSQAGGGASGGLDLGEVKPAFEMSAWTFPSQQWLDEYSAGYYDDLYGGGLYGSGGGGSGAYGAGGGLGF